MPRQIVVCRTQEDLFDAGAQSIVRSISSRPDPVAYHSMALSGGSTPRGLFARLTQEPYRSQIDWKSIRVFWGDERHVPPDHPESNFRMAKEYLLEHLPISSQQVFRIEGERKAEEAAHRYQEVLKQAFSLETGGVPRLDLVLLGMGSDAHTASLFPETTVLDEKDQWVAAPWIEKFQTHRITLTVPVFNAAKCIVFLVSGFDKAPAAKAVFEGPIRPRAYPAQLINPGQGDVIWLLDQAAASQLTNTPVLEWDRDKGIILE